MPATVGSRSLTSQEIDVSVNGDKGLEGDEQFGVVLSNAQGAPIVSGTGVVTIADDDPSGALRLSVGDVAVLEGDDGVHNAHVTVALSAPSAVPISVDYATADATASSPSDYAATSGTLTFEPGVRSISVPVPINGDGMFEPSEALSFNLSNAVGAPISRATAMVRLANDDPGPALSVGDVATVEGNSGTQTAYFTISLSTPSSTPVVVDWAISHQTTNDGDVKRKHGTVTFPSGALVETIQTIAAGDTGIEADETYHVTLANPVNATIAAATATGTVLNDDPSSGSNVGIGDASIYEGNSGSRRIKFTVNLADPVPNDIAVLFKTTAGTATPGTDYTANHGTVTIAAGTTTASVTISVASDAVVEGTETFTVTLTAPTGGASIGRATGTATILDDD